MFGGLKQGVQLPMDEIMSFLRKLRGVKYPSVVIYPTGYIHINELDGTSLFKFKDAQELLTYIRKHE